MRLYLLFFICFFSLNFSDAQPLQNVRGRILDKESKYPLIGVVISTGADSTIKIAANTDEEGYFKLQGVPVGRNTFNISYLGYKPIVLANILVSSAKELILNLEMEESIQEINEVVVTATRKDQPTNDMALISARSFTVEEADKYPASRQDPARMAGNFAGVNSTSDARNDIVIRGNSPMGLLWRVNDVDIPNPSHFAVAGSTGGPLSIINTKVLSTSDFMTGAFPAEYGNANAGVFDLKLRNGNNERKEFTIQAGVLGMEAAAEGPFSKKSKASYIATFRYSTLQLLQGLKIPIGTTAIPNYSDWSFKVNLPTKKAGNFSLFSLGGFSSIDIVLSDSTINPPKKLREKSNDPDLYGDQSRDQYFRTNMGVFGAQHSISINSKTFLTSTLSQTYQNVNVWHDFIYRDSLYNLDATKRILGNSQHEYRTALNMTLYKKFSGRSSLKAGWYATMYNFDVIDSARFDSLSVFRVRQDYNGTYFLIQPYIQWRFKITDMITLSAGVHGQFLTLNQQSNAIEPRIGASWNFRPGQTISIGYGLHSQMQPNYYYFTRPVAGSSEMSHKNIRPNRSQHFVITYDYIINKDIRFKTEAYYQNLWNIPVYNFPSSISLINQGASFSRFFPRGQMTNAGTGENYGIEFTLEKFYSYNYYILFTTSLYNSTYKGSDGIIRNTDFNGNYVFNLLAGYEPLIGKKKRTNLVTGAKLTYAGGKRYSPVDTSLSRQVLDYYPVESQINTLRVPDYLRLDLRIGLRINAQKLTHEIMIDMVNVLGIKNILSYAYTPDPANPRANPITPVYQLGFLPLLYYKLDF